MSAEALSALGLSIRVAVAATLLNALIGIPLAYLLARRAFRGRALVDLVVTLPLVLPPTVTGYYLIVLLGRRRHRVGRSRAREGRVHARALGVAHGARGHLAAGAQRHHRRARPRVRPRARGVRRDPDAGRQHPRQDDDGPAGDLYRGADGRDGRGGRARAGADRTLLSRADPGRASGGARRVSHRFSVEITKRLPGFTLDVSWTAGDGVAVLFGPSGAGKTLTLQCLAGLIRPDAGRIVVDDRVLFDAAAGVNLPPQQRRVGYVFQGYALFPHLTVAQNVGFGLRDRPRPERERRVVEVLERLDLGGLAHRRPSELSGGQRQRVALGRALAIDPALLLLDEPLSALDAPLRDELRSILSGWGTAAVLVTHDFTEAYRLADRIIVYENGRVIQSAPRAELLWQPASEAVARVMGLRNVLHGVVVKATPDRIQIAWRGHTLEAVNSPTRSYLPAPESPIAFFIRPEYVRLIRKDRSAPDAAHHMNLMRGTVVGEADFGTVWSLRLRLDTPGAPSQGDFDLEVEVPHLVYEILEIERDRHWEFSIHRGSIHVLPT